MSTEEFDDFYYFEDVIPVDNSPKVSLEEIKGKAIIHNNSKGDFTITYPITNCGLSADEIIKQISPLDNKYTIINQEEIPEDNTYSDCWIYDSENEKIDINVEKAKERQKNNIRSIRNKLLVEEDVIFLKSLESGDTLGQNESSSRKQILRDLPEIVNNIQITETTVDGISSQIESAWDENLLGEKDYVKKEKIIFDILDE
jgi:hypothetical protein